MTDERLLAGFRAFDAPIAPDPVFADRLFEELATELGFRAAPAASEPIALRLRRALGLDLRLPRTTVLRFGYLAAMLALLLALLAGTLFVVGRLLERPLLPADLVRMSQAAYDDPPPFTMVYTDPLGERTVFSSNGRGTWRVEPPNQTPGSYFLWDGERTGYYEAYSRTWDPEMASSGPITPLSTAFAWTTMGDDWTARRIPCAGAESIGEREVAGRPTDGIRCPDIDLRLWLDRETRLVLRLEAGPTTPGWEGGMTVDGVAVPSVMEAVDFRLGAGDPGGYDWAGPAGAHSPDNPSASTILEVGKAPPHWIGETADGASFDSADLAGPAALLFTDLQCRETCGMYDTFAAAAATRPEVSSLVVALATRGTTVGFRGIHPTELPIVVDPEWSLVTSWGLQATPTIVLLDREGNVAGIVQGRFTQADLERLLGSLAGGAPLPSLEPAPTPTPNPDATPFREVGEDEVTWLPRGEAMPAWAAPQMGGGTFESSSLRGRPAVIWPMLGASCDTCDVDGSLDAFSAAAAALGNRATFVLVAQSEPTQGWTERALAERGIDVTVVFDWDGRIMETLGYLVGGTLIADADGRLVTAFPNVPDVAAIANALDELPPAATPPPSPSPAPTPEP